MPEPIHFSPWNKRYWIGLLGMALLGVGIYVFFVKSGKADPPPARQGQNSAARAVSVVTAKAKTGEMNVYLPGLGTVTPLNMVTVKSRGDGHLLRHLLRDGVVVAARAHIA